MNWQEDEVGKSRRSRASRENPGNSAAIEKDIDRTMEEMRRTLEAIEERISPRRIYARSVDMILTPPGQVLLTLAIGRIIRKRPYMTTLVAAGAIVYFLSRMKRNRAQEWAPPVKAEDSAKKILPHPPQRIGGTEAEMRLGERVGP